MDTVLLEEDSYAVEGALSKVEDEVKTLEDEKFALLDQLVVLEGPDWSFRSAAQWVVVPFAGTPLIDALVHYHQCMVSKLSAKVCSSTFLVTRGD
jgi:hypothetical protein